MSLAHKQRELRELQTLKDSSGELVRSFETISHKLTELNHAAKVMAKVTSNWNEVFALVRTDKTNLVQIEREEGRGDESL